LPLGDDKVLHAAEQIGPPPYKEPGQGLALGKLSEEYGAFFKPDRLASGSRLMRSSVLYGRGIFSWQ
jgi:hypothetical protein